MEQWITDARYAARRLLRRPLYSALAVVTLAVGIGGVAAVWGIARAVLFDRLPYAHEETLVDFWDHFGWTQEEFAWVRDRLPAFSGLAEYDYGDETLELPDAPARVLPVVSSSASLFDVLGVHAEAGRTLARGDDVKGAEPVAVLSHALWEELGGGPDVIGSRLRINGVMRTVVGVMPRGFWFPDPTVRLWLAQPVDPEERIGNFTLIGRLRPGYDAHHLEATRSELTRMLAARFTYPDTWDKTRNAVLQPLREQLVAPMRPTIVATLIAVGMILLTACANVAALMLGQVEGRATELAVRSALGADRRRIARQLLAEAILLGVLSAALGALLATASFRLLVNALPLGAWSTTTTLRWSVFAVTLAVALASALGVSLIPVLALNHGRLAGTLSSSRTSGISARGLRLERTLVIAEVALAVTMAGGAGLLIRSVARLYALDPGVHAQGVGVVDIVLPADITAARRSGMMRDVIAAARGVPGVRSAASTQHLPLRAPWWNSGLRIPGKPGLPSTTTMVRMVSTDFFATMGIVVESGRGFVPADEPVPGVERDELPVVVTEEFVRRFFPGESPLNRLVSTGFSAKMGRIVGVVNDVAEGDLTDPAAPVRYLLAPTLSPVPWAQSLVFRSGTDPATLLRAVRAAVQGVSPRIAVLETTTMTAVVDKSLGPVRQMMTLLTLLAGLVVALGAIGVYGVISHLVARRAREWSIRIALGLRPSLVIARVVATGVILTVVGIAVGVALLMGLGRFLSPFLFGIAATDPASMAGAAAALLAIGATAALVPAARASRTDPALVLREQ